MRCIGDFDVEDSSLLIDGEQVHVSFADLEENKGLIVSETLDGMCFLEGDYHLDTSRPISTLRVWIRLLGKSSGRYCAGEGRSSEPSKPRFGFEKHSPVRTGMCSPI